MVTFSLDFCSYILGRQPFKKPETPHLLLQVEITDRSEFLLR